MFLGNNITVKKHDKNSFLLLFNEQSFDSNLENLTVATNLIYNSHIFPLLFSCFPCLSKSLRKDFLCKVNLADFK